MDPETLQSFYAKAEVDLAGIRNGILVFFQDRRSVSDLDIPIRALKALKLNARAMGMTDIDGLASECERFLEELLKDESAATDNGARRILDILARIEAFLLEIPLTDADFLKDISGFVDESFEYLTLERSTDCDRTGPKAEALFEIDEETLEIFRSEAAELLGGITANLGVLAAKPHDREALWEIRRCAHTFKGAAGIVGMKEASELAHRVEDLLDQLAGLRHEIDITVIDLLTASTDCLNSMAIGTGLADLSKRLATVYADFDRVISANKARKTNADRTRPGVPEPTLNGNTLSNTAASDRSSYVKPPPASIVRVSLDRLDELLKISRNLVINRSALAERFVEFSGRIAGDRTVPDAFETLETLFETQLRLTTEMQDKLLQIRMVRFGMLTTRLNRAVHVTCQEENKKAEFTIENEDLEIDTQLIDSLIEPLLHLLRNAVVHGIESPETRRLIGKPEKGRIEIRVKSDESQIVLSVSDDGRGISVAKLREKALSFGAISLESAKSLTDTEAFDLIFLRGVTTADTLNLNAGRGVGMSIVKESVERGGGSISIASEAQKGTTITIRTPLIFAAAHSDPVKDDRRPFSEKSESPEPEHSAGLRVLVVDDSASMRKMISKAVENAGWKAFTAKDGIDAIEFLSVVENRPDIILSDLEMPRLNGYELLEALKTDEKLCDIPVVMVTSRYDEAHRLRAFDLGAAEYVTKPYQEKSLIDVINQLCLVKA